MANSEKQIAINSVVGTLKRVESNARNPFPLPFGNQSDRGFFTNWLSTGLKTFYNFPNSSYNIPMGESYMMEYLGDVFEKSVPGNKRKIFCKAIGDVFRGNANNPEFPQEGFLDLIYLTSRLKTREPLEALASSVGYGTISKRDSKILDSTLSVILSFPPSKEVGNTMNVLIESPNFDNGYIFTATEILIKCNPLQVAEIVQKYKPRMLKLRDESRELGGDEWNTFKSVSKQWVKALSRIKTKSSRT